MEENQIDELKYEILDEECEKFDLSFKIILIGDIGVGKSCLSIRATKNSFNEGYKVTIGFETYNFYIKINGLAINLMIWDTSGDKQYSSLLPNYYSNSSLAIIVFAIDK